MRLSSVSSFKFWQIFLTCTCFVLSLFFGVVFSVLNADAAVISRAPHGLYTAFEDGGFFYFVELGQHPDSVQANTLKDLGIRTDFGVLAAASGLKKPVAPRLKKWIYHEFVPGEPGFLVLLESGKIHYVSKSQTIKLDSSFKFKTFVQYERSGSMQDFLVIDETNTALILNYNSGKFSVKKLLAAGRPLIDSAFDGKIIDAQRISDRAYIVLTNAKIIKLSIQDENVFIDDEVSFSSFKQKILPNASRDLISSFSANQFLADDQTLWLQANIMTYDSVATSYMSKDFILSFHQSLDQIINAFECVRPVFLEIDAEDHTLYFKEFRGLKKIQHNKFNSASRLPTVVSDYFFDADNLMKITGSKNQNALISKAFFVSSNYQIFERIKTNSKSNPPIILKGEMGYRDLFEREAKKTGINSLPKKEFSFAFVSRVNQSFELIYEFKGISPNELKRFGFEYRDGGLFLRQSDIEIDTDEVISVLADHEKKIAQKLSQCSALLSLKK